jgi:hypothetical protein
MEAGTEVGTEVGTQGNARTLLKQTDFKVWIRTEYSGIGVSRVRAICAHSTKCLHPDHSHAPNGV